MSVDSVARLAGDASQLPDDDRGNFTETGWTPPDGVTYERWAEIGNTLVRMAESAMWWLGDWWRWGEHTYGERAAQAAPTGRMVKTLQNAAWVADRVPAPRRRESLSFDHHSSVAGLPPAEQDELLDQAEANHLTTREVRTEVRQRRNGGGGQSANGNGSEAEYLVSNDQLATWQVKCEEAIRGRLQTVLIEPGKLLAAVRELQRGRGQ